MGSERSGIGGLLHVVGVSRKIVGNCVYMAQGILERITILSALNSFLVLVSCFMGSLSHLA